MFFRKRTNSYMQFLLTFPLAVISTCSSLFSHFISQDQGKIKVKFLKYFSVTVLNLPICLGHMGPCIEKLYMDPLMSFLLLNTMNCKVPEAILSGTDTLPPVKPGAGPFQYKIPQ